MFYYGIIRNADFPGGSGGAQLGGMGGRGEGGTKGSDPNPLPLHRELLNGLSFPSQSS